MFWSLLLEPGKRYTKVVDSPFHISAAVLDTTTQDQGIVRVIVDIGDAEAHIANLSIKHGILQSPLDLQFESGSRISFYTTGAKSNVHLSGYVMFEEEELPSDEEDDSSEEEAPTLVTAPVKRKPEENLAAGNKKAKIQKVAAATPNNTAAAAATAAAAKASPSKPAKVNAVPNKIVEEMDSDEDDDGAEDGLDDSDEGEEEEEEDDEEEDEDDESDDEEEDEDEVEMMEVAKQKQVKKTIADTPRQFPTKEQVNVFKMEKTPKGAKIPGNEGAKTPKGEKKTPKGAMTPGGEGAKTPKGGKTPGGEGAKTPKGARTPGGEGGAPDKSKKTPGKQQGATTAAAPTQNGKTPKAETPAKDPAKSPQTPKTVKQGGVVCEDLVVGKGPEAKGGKMVSVYYEGRLVSNKKMFDKCDSGKGFKFRLGGGEVIKGWDVGVAGMRIGGKRKITCPPHMAYGKKGAPPDIPGNAALSFVVELKGIS